MISFLGEGVDTMGGAIFSIFFKVRIDNFKISEQFSEQFKESKILPNQLCLTLPGNIYLHCLFPMIPHNTFDRQITVSTTTKNGHKSVH